MVASGNRLFQSSVRSCARLVSPAYAKASAEPYCTSTPAECSIASVARRRAHPALPNRDYLIQDVGETRAVFFSSSPFRLFHRPASQLFRLSEPPEIGSGISHVRQQRIIRFGLTRRLRDLLFHARCIVLQEGNRVEILGVVRVVQFAFESLPVRRFRFIEPI